MVPVKNSEEVVTFDFDCSISLIEYIVKIDLFTRKKTTDQVGFDSYKHSAGFLVGALFGDHAVVSVQGFICTIYDEYCEIYIN